jgi:hypothetical protein
MNMATITKSKSNESKSKRIASQKTKSKCGSNVPCENCSAKTTHEKPARQKKKPMYKLGCWKGTFKGTLDF